MSSQPPAGLEAVVFDLDGVLLDSRLANVAFYNHLLEVVGLPPMDQASEEVVHRESMEGSLRHLMGDGEHYDRAHAYWLKMDPTPFIQRVRRFPGARRALERLARRYRLAVATNRGRTTAQALAELGLEDAFDLVVTPLEAQAAKPDPQVMRLTLAGLGVRPEKAVYVGDSSVDEALCLASGVRLIAFQNPKLEAWSHIERMDQLPPLLGA